MVIEHGMAIFVHIVRKTSPPRALHRSASNSLHIIFIRVGKKWPRRFLINITVSERRSRKFDLFFQNVDKLTFAPIYTYKVWFAKKWNHLFNSGVWDSQKWKHLNWRVSAPYRVIQNFTLQDFFLVFSKWLQIVTKFSLGIPIKKVNQNHDLKLTLLPWQRQKGPMLCQWENHKNAQNDPSYNKHLLWNRFTARPQTRSTSSSEVYQKSDLGDFW